ncbi:hypothetical protein [Frankia nepalensis]|uniref:hypothetical protein n=1 Tax=Frankia nepalensis TaxID=1836974 RepID=UPI0027DE4E80|nr:hypothetical protein [Frankia nepalensis]
MSEDPSTAEPVSTHTEPLPDMFNNLHTDLDGTSAPAISGAPSASAGGESLTGTIVPANFPFPQGVTWDIADSKRTDATLKLTGVTPAAAVEYYRQALPTVGYRFFQESLEEGRTKVTFVGNHQSVLVLADAGVTLIFTQCTTAVQGEPVPERRSDRVACA